MRFELLSKIVNNFSNYANAITQLFFLILRCFTILLTLGNDRQPGANLVRHLFLYSSSQPAHTFCRTTICSVLFSSELLTCINLSHSCHGPYLLVFLLSETWLPSHIMI